MSGAATAPTALASSAADASPRRELALFDFDGTLTTAETFGAFVRAATPRWRYRLGALLLAPLVLAYRARLLGGPLVRAAVVFVAFRGLDSAHVQRVALAFVRDVLPGLLRVDALQQLRAHQARGDTVLVVSGAFDVYLRPWCEALGVDVLASVLEERNGRLTGRYRGRQCVGEEKARRVREACALPGFARVHAYGDTPEDHALLALAQVRHYRGQPLEPQVAG